MRRPFLALIAAPMSAFAQPVADAEAARPKGADVIEQVVVTAQRRTEKLNDVPIAVTAVGHDELARRSAVDLSDLAGAVPGLSIAGYTGGGASNLLSLRGVAGQVLPIGAGQPVALYLDDVYLSRPDAAFFGLDDVERIEVLRGPQGTLFGRNATAGTINIITRTPDSTLQGGSEVSLGDFDTIGARGSIRGPLGAGFSAGASASYDRHDGYIRNTVTGHRLNGREADTLRAKLRYQSSDGQFEASLAADRTDDDATPVFMNGYLPSGEWSGIGDPQEFASDAVTEAQVGRRTSNEGVALRMRLQASESLELVSVTGWRDFGSTTVYDADASALPSLITGVDNNSETFSQEVLGFFDGDRLRATFGANVFTDRARYGLSTSPPGTPLSFRDLFDTSDLTAWALFTQAEFDLAEKLTLAGGLRYDHEHRDFTIDYRGAPVPGRYLSGEIKDDAWIPSLTLMYRPASEVQFYAKASRGYQPPGFNFAPGAQSTSINTFGAETLWAYEVGAKTGFADKRVTLNVTAFHYDYSDIQIRSTVGLGLTRVDNAASASMHGVEVSLSARLPGGFTIGGQVTYLDSRYREFCQPISAGEPQYADPLCSPGVADRSGNRLSLAPTWSGGAELSYNAQLGSIMINASTAYDFSTSVFYVGAANEPVVSSGSWGKLRARIGLKMRNAIEFFVYGRNLTDERFLEFAARVAPTSLFEAVNEPRTVGVGVGYRY